MIFARPAGREKLDGFRGCGYVGRRLERLRAGLSAGGSRAMDRNSRNAMIIAACTLVSRMLGIIREMLLARAAGVTAEKNALDLAFMIPDILNHVVSTGFLAIIFIPIFLEYQVKKDEDGGWKFFSNTLTVMASVLLILLVPAFIWMRELIALFTSAANLDPALLDRATYFGRIILPGQFFIFVGSYFMAVQNCRKQFLIPALTGVIYNVAIICGGLIGGDAGLEGFAWGVPVGAFVGFFALQAFRGVRGGIRFRPTFDLKSPTLARYVKMMIPMSLGVGASFAFDFIIRVVGGYFGASGISSLNYAYRIMYTLVAVFGFSVGAAAYPDMSRLVKEGRINELNRDIWRSLSRMFVVLTAAVVAVWALAFPAVRILFERGSFTRENTEFIALLLRWYLPASLGLCMQIVMVRSFYAKEQMWTPTLINTGIFALTVPAYFLLAEPLGIYSVPIVGAAGALAQVVTMTIVWTRQNGHDGMKQALTNMGRALATLVTIVLLAWLVEKLSRNFVRTADLVPLIAWSGVVGAALFCLSIFLQKLIGSNDAAGIITDFSGKLTRKLGRLTGRKG